MSQRRQSLKAQREESVSAWVERFAAFQGEWNGLPPIMGRILGWLMVCEPAEQSAAQIAKATGASRASLTTNMRLLTSSGLVQRVSRRGERTAYYRIDDLAWEQVMRRRMASLRVFLRIAEDGLEIIGAASPRAGRLRAAHDIFTWAADAYERLPPPATRKRSR